MCIGNGFVIQGTKNPLFDDRTLVVDGVEEDLPLRSITFNVGIITAGIDTSYLTTNTRLFGNGISANGKSLSAGENNLLVEVHISTLVYLPQLMPH